MHSEETPYFAGDGLLVGACQKQVWCCMNTHVACNRCAGSSKITFGLMCFGFVLPVVCSPFTGVCLLVVVMCCNVAYDPYMFYLNAVPPLLAAVNDCINHSAPTAATTATPYKCNVACNTIS